MSDEAKRAHELITALRNDGYNVAYGSETNDDFTEHVEIAQEALDEPDELMGYYLVAMVEGQTDFHSSTVLGRGTPAAIAQIQMLGAHFRSVLEATGLDTTQLIDAMVDEALTIDEAELDLDLSIRDVFEHKDGTYHIRLDTDQPERNGERLVVPGDFEDPDKPDGDVYELPNGHRYEMGTTHDCGVADCPANVGGPDE